MSNNVIAFWKLIRPLNVLLAVFSLAVTADILHLFLVNLTTVSASVVIAAFTAGGNVVNDIFDLPADRINRPKRPLASGKISGNIAIGFAVILFVTGVVFSFNLNPAARILALVFILPFLLLYTPILKKIPLLGNIIIAALLGIVFIFSEIAITGYADKMWFPAGLAFGLTFIRELVKDMEDIKGDRKAGANTFPVRFGLAKSFYILLATGIILCLYAMVPYFLSQFGYLYFVLLVIGVELPLLFSLLWLSKKMTPLRCGTISLILKFCTLMGMIVIWTIGFY